MTENNFTNCILLAITILLVVIVKLTTTSSFRTIPIAFSTKADCEQILATFDCECWLGKNELEIRCYDPSFDTKVTVHNVPNLYLQIDCYKKDQNEFILRPVKNIGSFTMVQIGQCEVSQFERIKHIIQRLEIPQDFIIESGKPISQVHMKGFYSFDLRQFGNRYDPCERILFGDVFDIIKSEAYFEINESTGLRECSFLEPTNTTISVHLDVWSKNIGDLSIDPFKGVSFVADLDLSANYIDTLHPDVFFSLKQLASINLSGNFFKSLPKGLFTQNKKLTRFRLENNRIPLEYLPSGLLSNMSNLQEVLISCNLDTIPGDIFANSKSIRNITISGNDIIKLPYYLFADQIELIDLDLTRNKLISLPDDIFHSTEKLIVLRLSHNQLTKVTDEIFRSLQNLKILYMDNNNLLTISYKAFVRTRKLSYINMENNQIQFRDFFLRFLEEGEQFEMMSAFHHLPELRTLNLRKNSIHHILPELRKTNLKLEKLDLSYNKINMITDIDLLFRSSHIFVNLTHNNITRISFLGIDYVDINPSEKKIQVAVSYNPLNCYCDTLPFIQFLNGHLGSQLNDVLEVSAIDLKCSGPENLRGRLIQDLSPVELLCPMEYKRKRCPERCECKARPFDRVLQLNCSNAGFSEVPDLSTLPLQGVSSVTDFDLSANNIVTFLPGTFSFLKKLTSINLNGNFFKSLPEGLFAENEKLSRFRLENNRVPLKHLPSGFLSNLPNLREVRLSCNLDTIPANIFAYSTFIRNITISGNNLTKLPRNLFNNQSELVDLDLTRNKLICLPDNIFQNTRNLRVLRLSHNQLTRVFSYTFESLKNLEILFMDNNNLHTINWRSFSLSPKLSYINMENNIISRIENPLEENAELRTLNLRNNSLWDIPHKHPKLQNLDLSYNDIIEITHNDLLPRSSQIFLNLTYNSIRRIYFSGIDSFTRNLPEIKIQVAISYNPLFCDCKMVAFLQFLNGQLKIQLKNVLEVSANELKCSGPENLKGRLVQDLSPIELYCPVENDCPRGCSCIERRFDSFLLVNCTNAGLTEIPKLPLAASYNRTALYVDKNKLSSLPNISLPGYEKVYWLYANHNIISQIHVQNLPKDLQTLDLSHNKLNVLNFSVVEYLFKSQSLGSVSLGNNPWSCECDSEHLLQFVKIHPQKVSDLNQMLCYPEGEKFQFLAISDICPFEQNLMLAMSLLVALVALTLSTLLALYYIYQVEIKVWLYAHNMCLWFVTEEELDKDKIYDAFISFSHHDEDLVADFLVPELESGPTPFKLCVHLRDWIVGEFIPAQIESSVVESRRTIIVLSPHFIKSKWGRLEFRTAHTAALNEGRARVIVIIRGDIGNVDELYPELRVYLKMNTYLKWGDPRFWDKLRYAMPHPLKNNIALSPATISRNTEQTGKNPT